MKELFALSPRVETDWLEYMDHSCIYFAFIRTRVDPFGFGTNSIKRIQISKGNLLKHCTRLGQELERNQKDFRNKHNFSQSREEEI